MTISIHALLAESDFHLYASSGVDFAISIHALLAESDVFLLRKITITVDISIHALLAESDYLVRCQRPGWEISIHALLAESDREPTALRTPHQRFLSTLSLRRATKRSASSLPSMSISIHALLAESDLRRYPAILGNVISIHALLAESDVDQRCKFGWDDGFLSTLSLRRATAAGRLVLS